MTKAEYLAEFSRIVRWRLSYQEAEEVINDYEDLFAESKKTEDEMCEGLGSPAAAARVLNGGYSYGSWLAEFGIQMFSLIVPFFLLLSYGLLSIFIGYIDVIPGAVLFLSGVGIAASLIWFRRRREYHDKKIPKSIIFSLCGISFLAVLIGGASAYLLKILMQNQVSAYTADLWFNSITGTGILAALAGAVSVVKSRMYDRRWRAVYILALTLLLLCVFFLDVLTSLDCTFFPVQFLVEELKYYAVIGMTGILAAGVSLC